MTNCGFIYAVHLYWILLEFVEENNRKSEINGELL